MYSRARKLLANLMLLCSKAVGAALDTASNSTLGFTRDQCKTQRTPQHDQTPEYIMHIEVRFVSKGFAQAGLTQRWRIHPTESAPSSMALVYIQPFSSFEG
jgi:hypothetical protein